MLATCIFLYWKLGSLASLGLMEESWNVVWGHITNSNKWKGAEWPLVQLNSTWSKHHHLGAPYYTECSYTKDVVWEKIKSSFMLSFDFFVFFVTADSDKTYIEDVWLLIIIIGLLLLRDVSKNNHFFSFSIPRCLTLKN